MRAGAKRGAATISCRNSELPLSLPHEQADDSTDPDREAPVPKPLNSGGKARENIFSVYAAYPLDKSRFAGENPRKPNPHNWGFPRRKGLRAKRIQIEPFRRHAPAAPRPIDAIQRQSAQSAPAPVRTRIPAPPTPCPILRACGEAAPAASSPD